MVADTAFGGITTALAHEIKNPAALALAHVQLLRTPSPDPEKSIFYIERALEDIIDLAQEMLNTGIPLAFDFDLQALLGEIMDNYQAAWPHLTFHFAPAAPHTLRAPEVWIRMIVSNLIKNAIEADATDITLFCGEKENNLYLVIRDNGTGYDPTQKKPHGSGLGLPITRWLSHRMGGHLTLREGTDGGCEAIVRIQK